MRWLGLTWETVFDPCTNIAALGRVLSENYRAVAEGRDPQAALRLALSLYNTGNTSRGFRNGYVAKVVENAGVADTTLIASPDLMPPRFADNDLRSAVFTENTSMPAVPKVQSNPPPAWNVFERAAYDRNANNITATQEGAILWTN